jgi:programmed cell death protein 5
VVLDLAEAAEGNERQDRIRKAVYKRLKEMQAEQERRAQLQRLMEPDAYERLMNVRISNNELYAQLANLLIAMARSGRIRGKVTEVELRGLLAKLTYRPESRIEFKKK